MPREKMAGVEGVEPSHTVPETAVLPLDDEAMCQSQYLFTAKKFTSQ